MDGSQISEGRSQPDSAKEQRKQTKNKLILWQSGYFITSFSKMIEVNKTLCYNTFRDIF